MPAILLCFLHTQYGYYTIANLLNWYKNPAFVHLSPHLRLATTLTTYDVTVSRCNFHSV